MLARASSVLAIRDLPLCPLHGRPRGKPDIRPQVKAMVLTCLGHRTLAIPLQVVVAPASGAILSAPPVIVDDIYGQCGTILLHAEKGRELTEPIRDGFPFTDRRPGHAMTPRQYARLLTGAHASGSMRDKGEARWGCFHLLRTRALACLPVYCPPCEAV
jgi:hypothetical protein